MKSLLLLVIIACITLPLLSQPINELTLYTEQYPPFNFEDNGLKGISVDLIDEMLKAGGSRLTKKDIHWLRLNSIYIPMNIQIYFVIKVQCNKNITNGISINLVKVQLLNIKAVHTKA